MSKLDQSMAMLPSKDGSLVEANTAYEATTGMFGGWTAALLLKAAVEQSGTEAAPVALTVNYISRVPAGAALRNRCARLGQSKSVEHWRTEVYDEESDELLASATVLLSQRRPSQSAIDFAFPNPPLPEELPHLNPSGPFGQQTDTCPVYGNPPFGRTDMRSLVWVREKSGRNIDEIQLAYLSDVYAPRVFHISEGPRPSSTLTMTTYFLAPPEELALLGDDYVLTEAEGTRVAYSVAGSRARLWSRYGSLLATTEQLSWFK